MTGSISSAGIGSGLDVNGIISKLMAVEQAPLAKFQKAQASAQTQLSAFGQIQSLTSSLKDALTPLTVASNYAQTSSSSSDSAALSVSSTGAATTASYTVEVSALAATQTLVSPTAYGSSTATVGTGTLTLRLGTWSGGDPPTTFTPKPSSADVPITIAAPNDTLVGIRDAINAANAGVRASIITNSSGAARLSLQSTATGEENGFRIQVDDDDTTDTDNSGLSRLTYDPETAPAQMTRSRAAANAQATINGIAVSSTTNVFSTAVEGVTFTAAKVTEAGKPVTVSVSRNTESVRTLLNNFVSAYNALNGFINEMTRYDASTKTSAPLQADAAAVGLQNQLRAAIFQSGTASTAFTSMSSLGVEFSKSRDGSLSLNSTKVSAALDNIGELEKALANADNVNAANNGFARKLSALTDSLIGTSGTLTTKTKSIEARLSTIQKDQARAEERLASIEKRLRAQYTSLDTTMARANGLSQYVSQQITTWNKSRD